MRVRDSDEAGGPAPLWRIWGALFAYAALTALAVQLVLLPYVFPSWHAGNGLLAGGDWLMFHQLAADLAQKMRTEGWSAWELRPEGHVPAGIAAAIYVFTVPQPWTLIPLNAALHATAALLLLRIVQTFVPDWRLALWPVLPFVLYPSATAWYTQIHKDGYAILGFLAVLYGWMTLVRAGSWQGGWRLPAWGASAIVLGTLLLWLVRLYSVLVMQATAVALALLLTSVFVGRALRATWTWRRAVAGSLLAWAVVGVITPLTLTGPEKGDRREVVVPWQASDWLPAVVDERLYGVAVARENFRTLYPDAGSNIDTDLGFRSARDIVSYVPRAAQVGLLAPFPTFWFQPGASDLSTLTRRIAAMEMLGIYVALGLLPYAVWTWRRRTELWVLLACCGLLLLAHALVITNIGALHRFRYAYLMTLAALGVAAGLVAWRERQRRRACRSPETARQADGVHTGAHGAELARRGGD